MVGRGAVSRSKLCSLHSFQTRLFCSSSTLVMSPRSRSSRLEKSFTRRECYSSKEALHRFVARSAINVGNKGTSLLVPAADDWTDLVLRAVFEAHLRLHST